MEVMGERAWIGGLVELRLGMGMELGGDVRGEKRLRKTATRRNPRFGHGQMSPPVDESIERERRGGRGDRRRDGQSRGM